VLVKYFSLGLRAAYEAVSTKNSKRVEKSRVSRGPP
jgi:hypothetical protein